MTAWIDRTAALTLLGVKAQTLYAYVSRGRVSTMADPADPRRSLYREEDVTALTVRRARGRKPSTIAQSSMAWGEPAIPTALSVARHGKLFYRGENAMDLARTATLEQVAALLWQIEEPVRFDVHGSPGQSPFAALAAQIEGAEPSLGRSRARLSRDATAVVGLLAGAVGCADDDEPLHEQLARRWALDGGGADRLRRAMVAMADHDLNASTFATRVAASTGASLTASILAGLCALSGPRHGGAGKALMALLDQASREDPAVVCRRWIESERTLPGFAHPLYPDGDPRSDLMLEGLELDPLMARIRDLIFDATGQRPNCDFALAALVRLCGLPANAPFVLFMLGRSVGWCAHAIEQILDGELIRPRGQYIGPEPRE